MLFAPPECLEQTTAQSVHRHCLALCEAGAGGLLIFAGEEAGISTDEWDVLLRSLPVPVAGGIFPRVLYGAQSCAAGVLVAGLNGPVQAAVVENLDVMDEATEQAVRTAFAALENSRSILLWVDGLTDQLDYFVETVYDVLGGGPAMLGGASGNSRFAAFPSIFCNAGVRAQAAVAVGLPAVVGVGVEHGNEPVAGPFLVSAASGKRIHSLDFGPAVKVYCEAVHRLSGLRASAENFSSVARAFPLGMERMDGSFLLREPIAVDGDDILCVAEVSEQSTVHILHGTHANVLRGVTSACRTAAASGVRPAGVLVVDCLNRALYLDRIAAGQSSLIRSALGAFALSDAPIFGVLSLGEIASQGGSRLELHSKTVVLGLIPHDPG